jgi:hypothetical protein
MTKKAVTINYLKDKTCSLCAYGLLACVHFASPDFTCEEWTDRYPRPGGEKLKYKHNGK